MVENSEILEELRKLNDDFKKLTKKKQDLIKEIDKLNEEILKKVGAYNALKKLSNPNKEEEKSPPITTAEGTIGVEENNKERKPNDKP